MDIPVPGQVPSVAGQKKKSLSFSVSRVLNTFFFHIWYSLISLSEYRSQILCQKKQGKGSMLKSILFFQDRLRDEVVRQFSPSPSSPVSLQDLERAPYTEAFLLEVGKGLGALAAYRFWEICLLFWQKREGAWLVGYWVKKVWQGKKYGLEIEIPASKNAIKKNFRAMLLSLRYKLHQKTEWCATKTTSHCLTDKTTNSV